VIRAAGGLLEFSLIGREVSAWQRISRSSGPDRGRPPASAGICGGCYSFSYSPAKRRDGGDHCGSWMSLARCSCPMATERKLVSGIDDHSRFWLLAAVVRRATARSVWFALDLDGQVGAEQVLPMDQVDDSHSR
jgi:hypothetical protein